MKTIINAYLHLEGRCREAMSFYQDCFGGKLTLQAVKDSPMADQWPADLQNQILHASLISDNLVLLGSDMTDGEGAVIKGSNISLSITCSNGAEMEEFFSALSKDGEVKRPIHSFFAGRMAAVQDKYGIFWMLYSDKT